MGLEVVFENPVGRQCVQDVPSMYQRIVFRIYPDVASGEG